MKSPLAGLFALSLVLAAAIAANRPPADCRLVLELVDAETGEALPGLVRFIDSVGQPVLAGELLNRGQGVDNQPELARWFVLSRPTEVTLPKSPLTIEAFSGLETELAKATIDLTGRDRSELRVPLRRFASAREQGYQSANTHLHLMKIPRDEADRYLREVPAADRLDLVFVSHLERAGADQEYITNRYTAGDLARLTRESGVLFGNGEEHRHNFTAQGEGFGHVMLLNLRRLILPVSIGQGISGLGTDGLPLARGIDEARRDGATTIWCHNDWGFERLANQIAGRLDAQNIFDGGEHGSYSDSFYPVLNAGFRTSFSTGTDWFQYDFSRVYVELDQPLEVGSWLAGLSAGRTWITNGPLLEFEVDGLRPGRTVAFDEPREVTIRARATGRVDFRKLELVQNGAVLATGVSRPRQGHFVAEISQSVPVTGPCWFAVRTPSPPADRPDSKSADSRDDFPSNEFGRPLFAHTSPVYVTVAGKSHGDLAALRALTERLETNRRQVAERGDFADAAERSRVLDVYEEARQVLERLSASRN